MSKRRVFVVLICLLVAIQFIPVERTNPPVEGEVAAPASVQSILQRSCYDCHSHETEWPWYARVAPASWLVSRDVEHAREHLNFSTWQSYDMNEREELLEEIKEEVKEGEMPLWFYLPLHPDARLADGDLQTLVQWADAGASRVPEIDSAGGAALAVSVKAPPVAAQSGGP